MKIAIYGRNYNEGFIPYVKELLDKLSDNNVKVWVYKKFYHFIEQNIPNIEDYNFDLYARRKDITNKIDYLITIGGDGTILSIVTAIKSSLTPIVGINSGRLGFLSNIAKENISHTIDALLNKTFHIEERTLLQVDNKEANIAPYNFALNEVTLHKKDSASMMTIHTYIDGKFLNSYWADGLIVATPTGSTAYSLSCGGPILTPGSQNFVITPIAPHNLNIRPLIVPDSSTIKMIPTGRDSEFLATLDSRSIRIKPEDEITVTKTDFKIKLVQLEDQNFYKTIREKLLWGLDKRN